ncbi:MAG TPA: hypothetical protein VHB77_19950, partial [Planctomycetaceae bacterium]|nr:hypothetical protein [Planctomycetaceae bacterium]
MKPMRKLRDWLAHNLPAPARIVSTAALLAGVTLCQTGTAAAADARTIEGTVRRLTTAPKGETDGAVLDDGTWIHWPPHLEERFTDVVKAGDRVRATGRDEIGRRGEERFEVETVTNTDIRTSATNPDFAIGPPQPPRERDRRGPKGDRGPRGPRGGPERRGPERGEVTDVQGTITRFTTAPKGEVDGAMLDNGTWIHWPPHLEASFSRLLKEGDRVRATGATETGPRGDTKFEVSRVTNLRTNAVAENEDFERGPRGRGRPAPPDRTRRPLPPERGEITSVRGVVERMTTAPKGEVDGAMLENGTWLHWPPHLENQFTAILKVGDSVKAVGRTETGPAGDTHFEVSSVTNTH